MIDDSELARRKALTFEQAEGLAELPRQLRPDELPNSIRGELLVVFIDYMRSSCEVEFLYETKYLSPAWVSAIRSIYIEKYGQISAEFDRKFSTQAQFLENLFKKEKPHSVLGVIQRLLRSLDDYYLAGAVEKILEERCCAYRLIDGDTLMPVGSPEEAQVVNRALADVAQPGFGGANRHLKNAGGALSEGNFADSIRESVHAVESVLRTLTDEPSVSKALSALAKRRPLHEAFKRGIGQLYGFSSDEPGVRHPLLEKGDAAVSEEEAILMFGICAALVSYFIRTFSRR